VSPDGRFACAPTREFPPGNPEEGIRGYRIGADGSLTALPTPFGSGQSYEIAITPDGRFLYQQAGNQVRRFAIESDGTLAELGMTPAGGVSQLATSPDGRFLFVGIDDMSDGVRSFSIAADGSLTQIGEPAPTGDSTMGFFAVGPDGRHIFIPDYNLDGIVTAAVAVDGTLSVIDTMPVENPQAVAVSPDNRFLYYGNKRVYTGQSTTCPGGPEATTTASLDTPPSISGLAVTNKTFAVGTAPRNGKRGAAQPSRLEKSKRGTVFRFRLTERERVRFTIERKKPGRRVGRKCRPSTPKNRKRRKCTRFRKGRADSGCWKAGQEPDSVQRKAEGKESAAWPLPDDGGCHRLGRRQIGASARLVPDRRR
jgi:hypothetical protein